MKKKIIIGGALATVAALALVFAMNSGAWAAVTGELLPVADGTYSQWTPKSGSIHYAMVDEASCNGTTDFVRTTTVGERESFDVDLSAVPDGATITDLTIAPCASRQQTGSAGTSTMRLFYILNGATSTDSTPYLLPPGITPVPLTTSTWTGLSHVKNGSSSLEIGAWYVLGNKGVRLSRLSVIVGYAEAPAAPTGLAVENATNTLANDLSWTDNSSDELRFAIERGTDGVAFGEVASTTANVTTYRDAAVSAGTAYYYRVRAWNLYGYSAYSNVVSTTAVNPAPAAPTNLIAMASGTYPAAILSWTDNATNENLFSIERGLSTSTLTQVATTSANATLYMDSPLSPGATYYYRVRAQNGAGYSGYSNIASTTTAAGTPPAAPTNLTAFASSSNWVFLSWTDNAWNETYFRVERGFTSSTFTPIATTTFNQTTFNDFTVSSSLTYYYRVKAFGTFGSSTYSNTASTTTP